MAKITRSLDVYSIHGHLSPGSPSEQLLDYESFFRDLSNSGQGTSSRIGANTVAIVEVESRGVRRAFRFITGNADDLAEAFDPASGTAQPVRLGRERFIVSGIWVVVDPAARVMVVEKKRPGVPMFEIERFLSEFGRKNGYPELSISLNQVPSKSFAEEIEKFTRIREASITIRRPNHSFSAAAREAVAQIARDSNAGKATVQANAEPKQSLSKDQGLVADIISFAKNSIGPIYNATVKGIRPGFGKERTVSMKKHTLKGTAEFESSSSLGEQLDSLDSAAESLIEDAASRVGAEDAEN